MQKLPSQIYVDWSEFEYNLEENKHLITNSFESRIPQFLNATVNREYHNQIPYIKLSDHEKICHETVSGHYGCKFNLGDLVYLLHNNSVKCGIVKEIIIHYKSDNIIPEPGYTITLSDNQDYLTTGKKLFESKEKLIESL